MGRGGRCENIWRVLLIGSSVHPPIRVRNMGAHCAHVEDPRGSTHRIYYRDSVDASKERRRGLVGIPTLGGRTKICGAEKHCDIHWETTVTDWVATRPILDLCQKAEEPTEGGLPRQRW